ncbi:hypothetical protein PV08_11539 [Exophiala spinifera]|uniref:Exonuclease V, mitochondrial n=1 Tax=Exophiala spinifera TaxID=91928 RepID=A0A0D2AVW6_9EURO|nr:uncharacterized protein PV08_11539 [Exophiala spinifera]KIW10575.1 hypothetical protein PV08_11539 [Exophiala spinifera]
MPYTNNTSRFDHRHVQLESVCPENADTSEQHADEYSDFAEDPEELEIIDQLLLEVEARSDVIAPLLVTDIEDYEAPPGIYLPKVPGLESAHQRHDQTAPVQTQFEQDVRDQSAEKRPANEENESQREGPPAAEPPEPEDTRSPIERFRKPPKKPLSVTDLISPAWCELQYFYVLSKHGRKRRTPAMKQGSAVHQALEDEVHVTVPVRVVTKEDSWGLRLWNVIQGLRTLRETGRTREMEVWGSVGGEFVNGVIDELSYHCPDPKLEEQSLKFSMNQESGPVPPEYQASIRDYLVTSETREQGQSIEEALGAGNGNGNGNTLASQRMRSQQQPKDQKRIYITDVKTRGTSSLPTGSSIRPTIIQLHLYHYMVDNLAKGMFSLDDIAARYGVDIHATFSDDFIAQIGSLNQDMYDVSGSQHRQPGEMESEEEEAAAATAEWDIGPSTQDSLEILIQHNNLEKLWEFMMWQFRETFLMPGTADLDGAAAAAAFTPSADAQELYPSSTPQSISQLAGASPSPSTRLSPLLTARYVSATRETDAGEPELLGSRSIVFNPNFLRSYLYDALAFWRGERAPKGVELRDAWKCRVCEFRDDCAWIHERDQLAVREAEERRKMREVAGLEGADRAKRSRV